MTILLIKITIQTQYTSSFIKESVFGLEAMSSILAPNRRWKMHIFREEVELLKEKPKPFLVEGVRGRWHTQLGLCRVIQILEIQ